MVVVAAKHWHVKRTLPLLKKASEDKLSEALELLDQLLRNGTSDKRKYCKYCSAKMIIPLNCIEWIASFVGRGN